MPSISTSTTSPGSTGRELAGRAGQQDVAGLERDQPRDVGDLVGDAEEEVVPVWRLLDELAVDEGAQPRSSGSTSRGVDERGPERAEAVLALDAQHRAAVGVAEVVDAEVVGDRVAARRSAARRAADTPRQRSPITTAISPS